MAEQERDTELTPERVEKIQDILLQQYCDQYGLEIADIGKGGQNP